MTCASTNGQTCDAFDIDDVSIVTGEGERRRPVGRPAPRPS